MSTGRAGKHLPAHDGRRTGTNTRMLGLFSHFAGARQGDCPGAQGAQSWRCSSAHRGGGAKGLVDPIQSPLGSPPRNFTALEVPGTSLPLLIWDLWMLQTVSNLPNGARDLGPLCMFGDAPLTFPGAGLGGTPHPLHGPVHPTSAMALGATSVGLLVAGVVPSTALRPAPVGMAGEGSLPASSQGSPRAGEWLGVAWPLPPAWQRGCGPRADREALLT